MVEELKEKGRSQLESTGRLYQALKKIIMEAVWIPSEYRKIAESVENINVLNELYLCACDHVPVERVMLAVEVNNLEYLVAIRKSWLIDGIAQSYEAEFLELKDKLLTLEKENQMLEIAIETTVEEAPDTNSGEPMSIQAPSVDLPPAEACDNIVSHKAWWHRKTKKKKKATKVSDAYDRVSLVDSIMAAGFDNDQISFLLTCVEDNVDSAVIKNIAHPEYPVSVMEQLKRISEKV